ncbi:uncharacterized membrane protein C3orf80 homolog [Astyanax mexicanus]|uniref:uncharacterized membrane protein C3orf80 homolog n=1 Tax=Astyanax mexicanus TaxID=7994 RepID=UPI0020CADF1D|nr:uncharacterized membrane protein C3orf80 homolog [Astyanax mexicanus]
MGARLALLAALALRACQASRDCGDVSCGEHERCCARGNGSTSNGNGSSGAAARAFLDGAGWLARKLSGVLILLLLFAMGYFVQRVVCPRPRGRRERVRASRDTLLTTSSPPPLEPGTEFMWPAPLPPPPPPRLPAYDEVKHLPTYEESVQEAEEEEEEEEGLGGRRSQDNLLEAAGAQRRPAEDRRTAARQTRGSRNSV